MSRLSVTLSDLIQRGKKSLVVYVVAGDPSPDQTVALMDTIVDAGADVIELGIPFSDPEAEGPVIQKAHERALENEISLSSCLEMVKSFRKKNRQTPVVLMGYLNPIEAMGYEVFSRKASESGVDGTILVNLPPEEIVSFQGSLEKNDIEPVFLLAPTTNEKRGKLICETSRGFVYYVSVKGTTGRAEIDISEVGKRVEFFKQQSSLPILVGFGIRDPDTARQIGSVADGVVIGSAVVEMIDLYSPSSEEMLARVSDFVKKVRSALDGS